MGNLWTVQQSTGNLTSSGTALFRGDVQTLGQFLGDGGALDNVVYSVNSQEGALSVVGAGTVSVFTNAGTITVSGTSSVGEITTLSGYLQGQIDAVEATDVDSINGALGVLTLQGSDFINVSTVGQTITVSADAIVGGSNITVTSGVSTVTISSVSSPTESAIVAPADNLISVTSGTNTIVISAEAITGSDGLTVTSGANATNIAGFRGEFVAASGFLQGQIDGLDATYATDAQLTAVSGHLQTQIDVANADVSSLNGLQGALNIVGDSFIGVTAAGSSINLFADAIIAGQNITVTSGANSVTIASTASSNAIVGAGTVTVISGANTTTVSGASVIDKQFTAIGPISQYDLVYITSSGNRVAAARADSAATLEVIGMALAGAASGATVDVRLHGVVEGGSGGATVGVPLFLSDSSAGDFTATPPSTIGNFILQVGHAVNSADFYVNVNSATAIENSYETVPVLSINSVSGTITLAGAGQTSVVTQGQTITVNTPLDHAIVSGSPDLTVTSGTNRIIVSDNNRALIGADGITVTSGTNTVTLTGFRTEFVTASGYIQGQIDNLDATYATDAHLVSVSGHLQSQITTFSDHGNLSGLADDDHLQYFRTAATSETTRIVGGNDLLFQSDGSRGVPGSVTTLSIDGATGNLDTLGTLRVRGMSGVSLFDGDVVIKNLTVTGTQTIFNSVTDVVNNLTVSGSATIGDPNTPFEDKLLVRGDTDMVLDASRSADTVLELTHSGSAGSLDIAGINNGFTWWKITNRGDATFRDLTVTGTATFTGATAGIDHGQLNGLADDDHTQYILADGTRAFTGTVQATSSGTIDIGTPSVPFDEVFGTPVVREFVAVSGSPRRGMIAIDPNDQFVAYNGTAWIILG